MKISGVSKFIGAGVIAASLAILPLNVAAQGQTQDAAPNTAPDTYNRTNAEVDTANTYDDNDTDWGWLGLLGLTGLAGLLGLNRRETVHTRSTSDREVGVHTGSDYRR